MCLSVSSSIAFRICSFDPAWSVWTSSFILNEPARLYPTYSFWQRKSMKLFVHTLVCNINMPAHISTNSFTFYLKPPKNLENNESSSRKSEKWWGSPGRKPKINTFFFVCVWINNSKNTHPRQADLAAQVQSHDLVPQKSQNLPSESLWSPRCLGRLLPYASPLHSDTRKRNAHQNWDKTIKRITMNVLIQN